MLVQGGGALDKAPRPLIKELVVKDVNGSPATAVNGGTGLVVVDGNSNLVESEQYSDRDLEPRKGGGNLRVTFSEVHIVAHNKEEDEGEDHESQDQTDHSHSQGAELKVTETEDNHNVNGNFKGRLIRPEYEGWDNPFRAEGEISHDAELMLALWRQGNLSGNLKELLTQQKNPPDKNKDIPDGNIRSTSKDLSTESTGLVNNFNNKNNNNKHVLNNVGNGNGVYNNKSSNGTASHIHGTAVNNHRVPNYGGTQVGGTTGYNNKISSKQYESDKKKKPVECCSLM